MPDKPWEKPAPKGRPGKMTPAQRAEAKARAKKAGRPYPNLVDNMAAMKADGGDLRKRLTHKILSALNRGADADRSTLAGRIVRGASKGAYPGAAMMALGRDVARNSGGAWNKAAQREGRAAAVGGAALAALGGAAGAGGALGREAGERIATAINRRRGDRTYRAAGLRARLGAKGERAGMIAGVAAVPAAAAGGIGAAGYAAIRKPRDGDGDGKLNEGRARKADADHLAKGDDRRSRIKGLLMGAGLGGAAATAAGAGAGAVVASQISRFAGDNAARSRAIVARGARKFGVRGAVAGGALGALIGAKRKS